MRQEFDWMISKQATERFIRLPRSKRTKFIDFFDQLAKTVHVEPEGRFLDSEGIEFYLSTIDSMVITYKIDQAIKMVYILAIE